MRQRSHLRTGFVRGIAAQQFAKLRGKKYIVSNQSPGTAKQSSPQNHQQVLQSQHRNAPFTFPGVAPPSVEEPSRQMRRAGESPQDRL